MEQVVEQVESKEIEQRKQSKLKAEIEAIGTYAILSNCEVGDLLSVRDREVKVTKITPSRHITVCGTKGFDYMSTFTKVSIDALKSRIKVTPKNPNYDEEVMMRGIKLKEELEANIEANGEYKSNYKNSLFSLSLINAIIGSYKSNIYEG